MASLEQIIRPFQSPQPFGGRRVIATSIKIPEQTAHVTWGSVGTLPSAIETPSDQPAPGLSFITKTEDESLTEKSRVTEKVKITQEDNPDNFIVYERPKKMTFSPTDPTKSPTFVTAVTGASGGGSTQTASVTPPPAAATTPPAEPGSGDITVTRPTTGLWVKEEPTELTQIGDRTVIYSPPPLGPNETLVGDAVP